MKTIIVATDFSPPSRRAFSYGVHLARLMKAQVLALYVMDATDLRFAIHKQIPDIMSNSSLQLRQKIEEYIAKRFKRLLRRYGHSYKRISTRYARGVPSIEISRIAREVSAELIVVGARCRPALVGFLLGSTTRDLIRRAPCPILTLRVDTRTHSVPAMHVAQNVEPSPKDKQL